MTQQPAQQFSDTVVTFKQLNFAFRIGLSDRMEKAFEISCPSVPSLIQINCRGTRHVLIKEAALKTSLNLFETSMFRQVVRESFHVQANASGVAREVAILQR